MLKLLMLEITCIYMHLYIYVCDFYETKFSYHCMQPLCLYVRNSLHCVCTCVGVYFSGDGARRDSDGHYQITGRVDDVINVKGHRIGTAELESCMVCGHCFVCTYNVLPEYIYMYMHVHVHRELRCTVIFVAFPFTFDGAFVHSLMYLLYIASVECTCSCTYYLYMIVHWV